MARTTAALLLTLAALAPAAPADEVEHPMYRSWAAHPVGTAVVIRQVSESAVGKVESTTTYTLVERDAKQVVVEQVTVSDATGTLQESAPQRYTIRRAFPLFGNVKKEDVGKPAGATAQGEEEVTVAGKAYKAVWFDSKDSTEAGPALTRTWMSDEVPGRMLRAVTEVPSAKKSTTAEIVEIRRP